MGDVGRQIWGHVTVLRDPLRRHLEVAELLFPFLDARDHRRHRLGVGRLELLRLKLVPSRRELRHLELELLHAAVHLAAQMRHLLLHPLVEGV